MVAIRKTFEWHCAHRLEDHKGLCNSVHGHAYKLNVVVARDDGELEDINNSTKGMVVDFSELKKIVNTEIVDKFDHAFVYNEENKESKEIALFLKEKINQKLLGLPFRTTAENMVQWIVEELNDYFNLHKHPYKCIKAQLYETETSCAMYESKYKASCKRKPKPQKKLNEV